MEIIKLDDFMNKNEMFGGNISWSTPQYIESILTSESPDLSRCDLIKDIKPKINEGRHNDGIGFVTIEGKEYFLKYGPDLLEEFKAGYQLSKLKTEYPYFLNVYSLFECNYIPRGRSIPRLGQVMVAEKGGETIYEYLNRKSKEYFNKLIPDLETKINQLDDNITKILTEELTEEEKTYYEWDFKEKNMEKYNLITSKLTDLVKEFYLLLSKEYVTFQSEFVPLFIKNYKKILDMYLPVDIFTMNQYQSYIGDKKSDNFMVTTEPYQEGKDHINIKFGSKDFRVDNVCEWDNKKEYCFIYPVDFGSGGKMNESNLNEKLLPYYLNQWINSSIGNYLYSDNYDIKNGNILFLGNNVISFNFSKFSISNKLSNISLNKIFEKYNLFKININNPIKFYLEGQISMDDKTQNELDNLLKEFPLPKNDYRFQRVTNKIYNISKLEEAINIISILSNGNSVIYDEYNKGYRRYSSGFSFLEANGIQEMYNYFNDETIYKTFTVKID